MSDACQEFGLFLLFLSFSSSLSDPVYKAIGGDAVLKPPMDLPIQHIEWKYNEDIAAYWHGKEFECFGQFKGRCEVNSGTGALTITGLNLNDSGIYTPEINGRVLNKIELSVISRVPKPSVKTSCNTEMTRCILTCEGNTTNAKPVVHKWFIDGRDGPLQDDLFITQETKKNRFRCMMRNPVSNETSESFINPFIKQLYGGKGEDVILRPPSMTDTIKTIEWKHNEDIAAGWYGKKSECLGQFEGRCELNTDSGALTIKRLNLNDNGIYTPEINGRDSSKTHLSVISRVAKPSIKTSCNTEKTSCDLTCEGNTADSVLITYTWIIDGRDGPSDKVLTITEDTKEESFRCLMMNPVSSEISESIRNPIKQEQDRLASILAAVVVGIVLVLVIVIAAFFIYKHIRVKRRRQQIDIEIRIERWPEELDRTTHEMKALNRPPGDEVKQRKEQRDMWTEGWPEELDWTTHEMKALNRPPGDEVKQLRERTDMWTEGWPEELDWTTHEMKALNRPPGDEVKQLRERTEMWTEGWPEELDWTKHEMKAVNRSPGDEVDDSDTALDFSSGSETESKTTETSSKSPAEAAASDADQTTELNQDSEKSALMSDKKPRTNCEPPAIEQEANEPGDVD